MSGFIRQFSSSSPVLAIPPQSSHQNHLSAASFTHQHMPAYGHSPTPSHCPNFSTGRKRRRDEAAINLEPDSPEMALVKTGPGYASEASSQPGTWLQERETASEARAKASAGFVSFRSCKSQRLNTGTRHEILVLEPATAASCAPGTSATNSGDLVIDDFTLQLGIGWRRISSEEHIQAAARGWARFIENHYPLSNVNIHLESKSLQSYLVETSQGFYLFSEDLRRARLVSRDVHGAIRNLQQKPPVFEGTETLSRGSPHPSENHFDTPSIDAAMAMD